MKTYICLILLFIVNLGFAQTKIVACDTNSKSYIEISNLDTAIRFDFYSKTANLNFFLSFLSPQCVGTMLVKYNCIEVKLLEMPYPILIYSNKAHDSFIIRQINAINNLPENIKIKKTNHDSVSINGVDFYINNTTISFGERFCISYNISHEFNLHKYSNIDLEIFDKYKNTEISVFLFRINQRNKKRKAKLKIEMYEIVNNQNKLTRKIKFTIRKVMGKLKP